MTHVIAPDGRIVGLSGSHQYTGEKTGGEFASWLTHNPDPHEFIRYSYGRLAACNATLYNTSALARACVKKPASYVIGDGLYFRSAISGDFLDLSKNEAKNWSRRFSELLHREKIALGYYEKQALLYQEAKITGDAFLYFLREEHEDREINDLDLVPTGGYDINWRKSVSDQDSTQVILGIEVDSFGRRRGVHRTNGKYISFRDADGNQNVVQLLFRERAGQIRGYGCFYSEIARAKNIDRVWDATIVRMAQEAINIGSFTVNSSNPTMQARRAAKASTGGESEHVEELTGAAQMKPGSMYVLRGGEGLNFTDLKTPSSNFDLANEWTLKLFSMAVGYPPEFLLGEYSTSYTAHRGALNDAMKRCLQERKTVTRIVDDVVNFELLKKFIDRGELKVRPQFLTSRAAQKAYLAGAYLGPVPGHVNPLQEIKADLAAVDGAVRLRSDVATKYGHDYWADIEEWHEQQNEFRKGLNGGKNE